MIGGSGVPRLRSDSPETQAQTGVFAPRVSSGSKIGPVAATYVAQLSCPDSCPFLHHGCYAENGFIGGFITKRLAKFVDPDMTLLQLALNEAKEIDALPADRDLRLHVVGDSPTIEGTILIAQASERYMDRGGFRVWTYTHAWRTVPRWSWGRVSVLASCENATDILEAHAAGYATAIVVERQTSPKRYAVGPLNLLPCPEQTNGITCADCRLCTDDTRLRESNLTVAFAVHGRGKGGQARNALTRRRAYNAVGAR